MIKKIMSFGINEAKGIEGFGQLAHLEVLKDH